MSEALTITHESTLPASRPLLPGVPWRDPHSVPPAELARYISDLELACIEHPQSADLRTCLGMAHAVNYDVYKSMDALEAALVLDRTHFWAQLKYAELQYRLRALPCAEKEAAKAVDLAQSRGQLAVARKQLQDIRRLNRDSTRNITWDKPLAVPALMLAAIMALLLFAGMTWGW